MTDKEWIKQRLPSDATFSKNDVVVTLDEAIDDALDEHSDADSTVAQKKLALADLYEILAADVKYAEERLGEWTGKGAVFTSRSETLREEASAGVSSPGGFQNVSATFSSQSDGWGGADEFRA